MSENETPESAPVRLSRKKPWIWLGSSVVALIALAFVLYLLTPSKAQKAIDGARAAGLPVDAAAMKLRYPAPPVEKLAATRTLGTELNAMKYPDRATVPGTDYPPELFNQWHRALRDHAATLEKLDVAVATGVPVLQPNFDRADFDSAGVNSLKALANLYASRIYYMAEWGKSFQIVDYWQQMNRLFTVAAEAPGMAGLHQAVQISAMQCSVLKDLAVNGFWSRFNNLQLANWSKALEADEAILLRRRTAVIADEIYLQVAWVANPEAVICGYGQPKTKDDAAANITKLTALHTALSSGQKPVLPAELNHIDTAIQQSQLIRLALAVEAFRRQNGKLPTALTELVPAFCSKLPTDPETGDAYQYQTGSFEVGKRTVNGFGIRAGVKNLFIVAVQ